MEQAPSAGFLASHRTDVRSSYFGIVPSRCTHLYTRCGVCGPSVFKIPQAFLGTWYGTV